MPPFEPCQTALSQMLSSVLVQISVQEGDSFIVLFSQIAPSSVRVNDKSVFCELNIGSCAK